MRQRCIECFDEFMGSHGLEIDLLRLPDNYSRQYLGRFAWVCHAYTTQL